MVDTTWTARSQVINRELLDALPTGKTAQPLAAALVTGVFVMKAATTKANVREWLSACLGPEAHHVVDAMDMRPMLRANTGQWAEARSTGAYGPPTRVIKRNG